MDILGVGPTEIILIVILALILIGPKDMEKTSRAIGKWVNDILHSDAWKAIQNTSRELRHLPNQFMRDDNLERNEADGKTPAQTNAGTWAGQGKIIPPPADLVHAPAAKDAPRAPRSAKKKSAAATRGKTSPAKTSRKKPAAKPSVRASRKKSNG